MTASRVDLATRHAVVALIRDGTPNAAAGRAHGLSHPTTKGIVDWARRQGLLPERPTRQKAPPKPVDDRWAEDVAILQAAVAIGGDLRLRFRPTILRKRAGLHDDVDHGVGRIQRVIDRGWLGQNQADGTTGSMMFVTAAGYKIAGAQPWWLAEPERQRA